MSTRRWAVVTAVAGTVFIAGGAFWLSFTALADLASRSGIAVGQAWAWPLIVDGIIVVATVAVVALSGQRVAWYPWALLVGGAAVSVTANALHAVVAADADVPGLLAACVAAVPPVVLLAITHLTVVLTRTGGAGHFPPDNEVALPDAREPLPASQTTAVHLPGATRRCLGLHRQPQIRSLMARTLPRSRIRNRDESRRSGGGRRGGRTRRSRVSLACTRPRSGDGSPRSTYPTTPPASSIPTTVTTARRR